MRLSIDFRRICDDGGSTGYDGLSLSTASLPVECGQIVLLKEQGKCWA